MRHAPSPLSEASTSRMKESSLVGARKTGAEVRSCLMVSKAVWASDDQENEECGLASSCRRAAITEKLRIKRSQNWDMPKNSFKALACVGTGKSLIHWTRTGSRKFVPFQLYDLNMARQFEKTCISRHSVSNRIVEFDLKLCVHLKDVVGNQSL